jgi:hypothetical protein
MRYFAVTLAVAALTFVSVTLGGSDASACSRAEWLRCACPGQTSCP